MPDLRDRTVSALRELQRVQRQGCRICWCAKKWGDTENQEDGCGLTLGRSWVYAVMTVTEIRHLEQVSGTLKVKHGRHSHIAYRP